MTAPDLSRVLAVVQPRCAPDDATAIDPACCPTCREAWQQQQERAAWRVLHAAGGLR